MSANSPPSSASSPFSGENNNVAPRDGRRASRRNYRDESAISQRNGLQLAAGSLEAAFARLEQVRASLVQLSDRLSDSNSQIGIRGQLGPSHEAIILTGSQVEEPARYLTPEPDQVNVISGFQHSLRRAAQAQSTLTQLVEQNAALRQAQSGVNPQPSQLRMQHRPLPSDPQGLRYFETPLDDGVTAIGRRVAARSVVGTHNSQETLEIDVGVSYAPGRPERAESGRLDPLVEEALSAAQRASQTGDLNELRRLAQIQNQLSSPINPAHQWRQDTRRRRHMRTESRQTPSTTRSTVSDHMSRLSMLSNISLNNFSSVTPPSSGNLLSQRPLLFDEPDSFTTSPLQDWTDGPEFIEDTPFGRSYIIRRRLDNGGAERVQSIPFEWDVLDTHWTGSGDSSTAENPVIRRRMLSNFQERTQRAVPHSPTLEHGSNRRRGWARLDPDGNEIPSEEEEELERYRTEYRIQAANIQARAAALAERIESQLYPHIMHGSVLDSVTQIDDSVVHSRRTYPKGLDTKLDLGAFRVSPLPMPLDEMIPSKKAAQDEQLVVVVPRYSSFAGR